MIAQDILIPIGASISAAVISAFVALKTKKADVYTSIAATNSTEIQNIFDGYARIVEDLQTEVLRLQAQLEIVRVEQQECDGHRIALEVEVTKLQHRLSLLEGDGNVK